MTGEENEAIIDFEREVEDGILLESDIILELNTAKIISNLIKKQQKELEQEKEKNKELENKIDKIKNLIDTNPYTAYTLYGDILYDDQAIRDIIINYCPMCGREKKSKLDGVNITYAELREWLTNYEFRTKERESNGK